MLCTRPLSLPVGNGESAYRRDRCDSSMELKQIAVIEPDYAHFRWIRFILRETWSDVECTRFESAVAACDYWAAESSRPDLVLMSWRLPMLKGPDAIQRIHSLSGFERVPLIAMAASDPERQQAENAGVPVISSPVNEALSEVLRGKTSKPRRKGSAAAGMRPS